MNAHVVAYHRHMHKQRPFDFGWWLAYPELLAARRRRWAV